MAHKPPANSEALLRQADRIMASQAYWQQGHPDQVIAHQTVRKIFTAVHGTDPVQEPLEVRVRTDRDRGDAA